MTEWLNKSRGPSYPDYLLFFKKDQTHIVQMLDDKPPVQVWRHSARDDMNRFYKVLCVGPRNGCRFCAYNAHPKFAKVKNGDRKYPVGSEYVKAVFVQDENRYALMYGNEIWKRVEKTVYSEWGADIVGLPLKATRSDDGKTSYDVGVPKDAVKTPLPSGLVIPKVEEYMAWLQKNCDAIPEANPEDDVTTGVNVAVSSPDGLVTVRTDTVEAPKKVATGVMAVSPERVVLNEALSAAMTKSFRSECMTAAMKKVAPGKNDLNALTDEELAAFISEYKKATGQ